MPYQLYIGTYTQKLPYVDGKGEGIYRLDMDADSGELINLELACRTTNPSFLVLHPWVQWLYAVNELFSWRGRPGGAVSAYAIQEDGRLLQRYQRSSGGEAPCYVSLDASGHILLVANYASGTVSLLRVMPDARLSRIRSRGIHNGSGPDPNRQESAHAHSIRIHPNQLWALAADLGIDRLVIYRPVGCQLIPHSKASLPPGAGPRHFEFHPSDHLLYIANELSNSVTVMRFDPATAATEIVQTISTLPAGFAGENTASDIHLSPDGRFLYVSNRGHDSLAVFQLENDGRLSPAGHQLALGRTPRNFCITPDGQFLIVANQDSDSLVVFRLEKSSGTLHPTGISMPIPTPVCVVATEK
jgi:6-phosphogluconolactonase